MGQPLVLYGTTNGIVTAGKIGAISDELALRNFTDRILRIKELRFNFQDSGSDEKYVPTAGVKLRISNEDCSNGHIPLGAMTWPIDVDPTVNGPNKSFPARCGFARPVYLAPSERLHVSIQMPATWEAAGATSFTPFVTAECQVEDRGVDPRAGFLPWFDGYTATARTAVGIYSEQTDPPIFQNNFETPLLVDRFIGNWTLDPKRYRQNTWHVDDRFGADFIRIRCEDHLSNQIVRDATPFAIVFDQSRRYWRAKTVLAPKGFFRFTVESDLRSASLPSGISNFTQPIIGMLGFRPASVGR